ncbi:MAG: 50S ribosomal protein L11 methyltransferase [Asticcacaulis sp.]|uniref:class I SAM-dependent methyltransferase n=1 Tax=Asticcacaulis sp. TaxID=1872648 RepID=UPI0039E71B9B
MPDAREFILQNLRLEPAPGLPEINLYRAHAGSRLSRLGDTPPYWAYHWAGGTVLARYILDHPESVCGKGVIDLGAGSGVVGIAAMKAGARSVTAIDIDPNAVMAARLNAEANGVTLTTVQGELTAPPDADLILGGDVFYDAVLAEKMSALFTACVAKGIEVLVGDMGRKSLPIERLEPVAAYEVPDFGQAQLLEARVFKFKGSQTP